MHFLIASYTQLFLLRFEFGKLLLSFSLKLLLRSFKFNFFQFLLLLYFLFHFLHFGVEIFILLEHAHRITIRFLHRYFILTSGVGVDMGINIQIVVVEADEHAVPML